MAVDLWYNLSGLVRGQKESSSEGRLGTQTWRFGSAGPRSKRTAKHEETRPKLGRLFEVVPETEGKAPFADREDGRFDHIRMVSGEASEAHRRGGGDGQFGPRPRMPVLRIRGPREGRQEEGRRAEIPLPFLRKEVQPADRDRLRLP